MKSRRRASAPSDAVRASPQASPDLQAYGNSAAAAALDDDRVLQKRSPTTERVVVDGQQVLVSNPGDADRAARIIAEIEREYGVDVNSRAAVDAMRSRFTWLPQETLDQLVTSEWTVEGLAAIQRALEHFAPILGDDRDHSSRAGTPQEVQSVSMMDRSVNVKGQLDGRVGGQYFGLARTFAMFKGGMKYTPDFPDVRKQMEGTAVHEIAHGVLKQDLEDFIAAIDYWLDRDTPSGKPGAEKPITEYGRTSADEDLSESAMFFFVEPETMKRKCPERTAWLEEVTAGWEEEAPATASTPRPSGSWAWWK